MAGLRPPPTIRPEFDAHPEAERAEDFPRTVARRRECRFSFREGRTVTDIADALRIGRGSVYRALEAAGVKQPSAKGDAVAFMST